MYKVQSLNCLFVCLFAEMRLTCHRFAFISLLLLLLLIVALHIIAHTTYNWKDSDFNPILSRYSVLSLAYETDSNCFESFTQ